MTYDDILEAAASYHTTNSTYGTCDPCVFVSGHQAVAAKARMDLCMAMSHEHADEDRENSAAGYGRSRLEGQSKWSIQRYGPLGQDGDPDIWSALDLIYCVLRRKPGRDWR